MNFRCSEMMLVSLIKQTNTTFVNLRGAFICFVLYNNILSLKVCFDRMALVLLIGIISIFFRSLVKISWPLSYFGIFMAIKEEGVSQLFLRIFPKKKKLSNQKTRYARTRHFYAMLILLFFSDVFLHFKNVFIGHVWEVNNCTAWVKPMFWNRSETVWNFIKTLWMKTAETQETHNIVLTLKDVYMTSLDFS